MMFPKLKTHRKRFFFCLFLISLGLFNLYDSLRFKNGGNSGSFLLIIGVICAIYIYAKHSRKE